MTGFRVDPAELFEFARELEQREPFGALATAASRLSVPESPNATSGALDRFKARLVEELVDLATATGSLGHATRSAADGYQEVDDSIRSTSTP